MTDYAVLLGIAKAGLLDALRDIGNVLNRNKIDDETKNDLQSVHAHLSDVVQRIRT